MNRRKRDYNQSGLREKLDWIEETVIEHGQVRASITSATKTSGQKLYSVNFFKEYNERRSGHFRPVDLGSLTKAIADVDIWIEADKGERFNQRDTANVRSRW